MPLLVFGLKSLSNKNIDQIAQNLEFVGDPYEIKDITEGMKYAWSSEKHYFWATPKKSNLRYGLNQLPATTELNTMSEDELRKNALSFLTDNFELSPDVIDVASIIPLTLSRMGESGLIPTTKDNAQLYQVNFLYKSAERVIFTSNPNHPTVFVQILSDGRVYKAEAYIFESIKQTEEKLPILTPNEIKNNLSEAKVNTFLNDYININDIDVSKIRFIEISKVTLGYYFNELEISSPLQPVYLLEGKTKVEGTQADFAQLYLPAINPANR